eukprot:tig00000903_g5518.t1
MPPSADDDDRRRLKQSIGLPHDEFLLETFEGTALLEPASEDELGRGDLLVFQSALAWIRAESGLFKSCPSTLVYSLAAVREVLKTGSDVMRILILNAGSRTTSECVLRSPVRDVVFDALTAAIARNAVALKRALGPNSPALDNAGLVPRGVRKSEPRARKVWHGPDLGTPASEEPARPAAGARAPAQPLPRIRSGSEAGPSRQEEPAISSVRARAAAAFAERLAGGPPPRATWHEYVEPDGREYLFNVRTGECVPKAAARVHMAAAEAAARGWEPPSRGESLAEGEDDGCLGAEALPPALSSSLDPLDQAPREEPLAPPAEPGADRRGNASPTPHLRAALAEEGRYASRAGRAPRDDGLWDSSVDGSHVDEDLLWMTHASGAAFGTHRRVGAGAGYGAGTPIAPHDDLFKVKRPFDACCGWVPSWVNCSDKPPAFPAP